MKKTLIAIMLIMFASAALAACSGTDISEPAEHQVRTHGEVVVIFEGDFNDDEPDEDPVSECEDQVDGSDGGDHLDGYSQDGLEGEECQNFASLYSIEQIQSALMPQLQVGDWGEGDPQVIFAERVERDIDSFYDERDRSTIDLSRASRYRVTLKYRQPFEDYLIYKTIYDDELPDMQNPFRRDGDYTILTSYYYFNDENGEPVLPFVMC